MLGNVSYRYKIALALTAVILLTEAVVTTALVSRAFSDARRDLETSAQSLARALARSVRDPLARDDLWHAYETIRTPMATRDPTNPLKEVLVLDADGNVFAASDPARYPVLLAAADLPAARRDALAALRAGNREFHFDFPGLRSPDDVTAAMPVRSDDGTVLGYLLTAYDPAKLTDRIESSLLEIAFLSVPGLVFLLVLGWLAGDRMAAPMRGLAAAMGKVGREPPETIANALPAGGSDEIGQLASQFRAMLGELAEKQALEREMIAAERLAAVGRVAAGIAHEINNPLGGMINAVDTLARHGHPDALTQKTLGLIERGLAQIRATVGALLVEARIGSPALSRADWQDLKTLIEPQLAPGHATLEWDVRVDDAVGLPAHLVRQLVLNLLLNAAKAVETGGRVRCRAALDGGTLSIEVANSGAHIPRSAMDRLFEPFHSAAGQRGAGFGLWVSYQIVRELGGTITAASEPGNTVFRVELPAPATAMRAEAA